VAYGCLSPHHATQFKGFVKQLRSRYALSSILKGDAKWPSDAKDRDVLYFLVQSFRAQLLKELPPHREAMSGSARDFAHTAKGLLKDLSLISLEMAQMVVYEEKNGEALPSWFMVDIVRDLPRLVEKKG
jgi:hypothetical protein